MRVMVIVKANKDSEAGVMPDEKLLDRHGQVQRRAGEGRHHARRRGAAAQLEGQARPVRRHEAHRDRRPVRRDQGADRRLLALAGEVDGGGDRVGEALPEPACRGRARSRSARCSRRRTSAPSCTPELREQEERSASVEQQNARRESAQAALLGARSDGVIGGRDGRRHPSRHRRGLAHRVARLIAGLARIVRDVGLAEDLAQDALVAALEQWPRAGVPDNPGAWLMATAKHRAIDHLRREPAARAQARGARPRARGASRSVAMPDLDAALDDDIGDDLLRLIFTACHPVLSTEARVALTLRLLGGLTTDEIARAFLVPEPTIAQRIVRAKRTLAEARRAVRGAARRRAARRGCRRCSRSIYLDLQRRLRGHRRRRLDAARALRGRAATRPHAGGARAATSRKCTASWR